MTETDEDILLEQRGFVHLPACGLQEQVIQASKIIGAVSLNLILDENVSELLPYERHAAPTRSLSSITGMGKQPPHTDEAHILVPARFMMLRCEVATSPAVSTTIIAPDLKKLTTSEKFSLERSQWSSVRLPGQGFYCSVLQNVGGLSRIRYDPMCMIARRGEVDAATLLLSISDCYHVDWNTNEAVLIDNWKCLHFRGAVPPEARHRRLMRRYWR